MEEWKDIEGYEGLYQVSNYGRVKYLGGNRYKITRILKGNIGIRGYVRVNLYKNGKVHTYNIHRLVAEAFIPNIENKPQVDHINTVRTDNRVENLRWVTNRENSNNQLTKIKMQQAHKGTNVKLYSIDGDLIKEYSSINQIAKENKCAWWSVKNSIIANKEFNGFILKEA